MIADRLHERTHPALTTFDSSIPETDRETVRELVKDPFILDFLAADAVKDRNQSTVLIEKHETWLARRSKRTPQAPWTPGAT